MKTHIATTIHTLAILVIVAGLSACASVRTAEVSGMTVANSRSDEPAGSGPYHNAITLGPVQVENEEALWFPVKTADFEKALRDSLNAAGLLAQSPAQAHYELSANLIAIQHDEMNITYLSSVVGYQLKDRKTREVIFQEPIATTTEPRFGDSIIGVTRMRITNERAIRMNFEKLIGRLVIETQGQVAGQMR